MVVAGAPLYSAIRQFGRRLCRQWLVDSSGPRSEPAWHIGSQCVLLIMLFDAERCPLSREWFVFLLGSWRAPSSWKPRRSTFDRAARDQHALLFGSAFRCGQGGLEDGAWTLMTMVVWSHVATGRLHVFGQFDCIASRHDPIQHGGCLLFELAGISGFVCLRDACDGRSMAVGSVLLHLEP